MSKLSTGYIWRWIDASSPIVGIELFSDAELPDDYCSLQMQAFCHERGFKVPVLLEKVKAKSFDETFYREEW